MLTCSRIRLLNNLLASLLPLNSKIHLNVLTNTHPLETWTLFTDYNGYYSNEDRAYCLGTYADHLRMGPLMHYSGLQGTCKNAVRKAQRHQLGDQSLQSTVLEAYEHVYSSIKVD